MIQNEWERFWSKVSIADNGCWNWSAARYDTGYGLFSIPGGLSHTKAHIRAYQLLVGEVPNGLELDHLCRNRACVNPSHLEPVTRRENILRGVGPSAINAKKTHCIRGHELSGENLRDYGYGRQCRICQNIRNNERKRLWRVKRKLMKFYGPQFLSLQQTTQ